MSKTRRKIQVIFLILLSAALLLADAAIAKDAVTGYRSVFKPVNVSGGGFKIAIRRFRLNGTLKYLTVDPATFDTAVIDVASVRGARIDKKELDETPFMKALKRYNAHTDTLRNNGLTGAQTPGGMFLTIDMCPSHMPFERELFTSTMRIPNHNKPVPVSIAISGLWIERHSVEFDWLLKEIESKKLDVTWINHSYSHPYDENTPLEENFLLTHGVDFEKEVLKNEALLLEHNLTPSPFFRYPGLVSNNETARKLKTLSLIPIGADAWLAKGAEPSAGSIILVHGNGNEPEGIKKLIAFYDRNKAAFERGELQLLPIADAFRTVPAPR